jgi:hypothetical protein
MHVTPVDSRKFSVLPLLTRLFFVPTLAPLTLSPCPLCLFAPCLRSLCVGSAFRVHRRYAPGQVIQMDKRAF